MRTFSETSGTTLNAPKFKLLGFQNKKRKRTEKIFEEIIVEKFPNMGKEIVNQVQEAQRVPYKINPRRNTPRHIFIKLSKIKYKGKILKAAREKQQITYKEIPIRLTADLSAETLQARWVWQDRFKVMKGTNLQPRLLYPGGRGCNSEEIWGYMYMYG